MRIGRAEEGVEIEIDRPLVTFMLQFPELLDQIGRGDDDPAAERLNVPVYLDDREANDEYWSLMSSELDRSREADRSAFREVLDAAPGGTIASREEAYAMVRVINEARLVLAARFGVDTEDDYQRLEDSESDILQALAELQMALLWALGP
jgi:hypothetical protein